jgi:hypothetical protein
VGAKATSIWQAAGGAVGEVLGGASYPVHVLLARTNGAVTVTPVMDTATVPVFSTVS